MGVGISAWWVLLVSACVVCSAEWAVEIQISDIDKYTDENRLSLVVFAAKEAGRFDLQDNVIPSAIGLLKDEKNNIKIFITDASSALSEVEEKYGVHKLPEVRLFWKGIQMLPPSLPKETPTILYRWIKQHIRSSGHSTLRELDTVSFFEKYKEKNPFIVVGLGAKDSPEARFLQEFSKNPRNTFVCYIIQEKYAKEIFMSIGLSTSKFNLIVINNIGKVIKEYDGDLDYKLFWNYLIDQTKHLGAFNIKDKEPFLGNLASTGQPFALLSLSNSSYHSLDHGFIKKMRTISNEYRMSVLYGINNEKVHQNFEYNDCEKTENCLFVYTDYTYSHKKNRYKFLLEGTDYKAIDKNMLRYKYEKPQLYHYSSSYRPLEVDDKFVVLSRDNIETYLNQGKDIFVMLFKYCGSNCHDKLKYMSDSLKEFSGNIIDKITYAVCNVVINEMPNEYNISGDVGFLYIRPDKSEPGKRKYIELSNYSSGYYIAKDIVKHASFEVKLKDEEEEDLEDYL